MNKHAALHPALAIGHILKPLSLAGARYRIAVLTFNFWPLIVLALLSMFKSFFDLYIINSKISDRCSVVILVQIVITNGRFIEFSFKGPAFIVPFTLARNKFFMLRGVICNIKCFIFYHNF